MNPAKDFEEGFYEPERNQGHHGKPIETTQVWAHRGSQNLD